MAFNWWQKKPEELPAELRDLTPEQLLEKINQGNTAAEAARIAQEKVTATETENARLSGEVNTINQRLQELTEATRDRRRPANEETEVPSVITDEDGAFRHRMAPLANYAFNSAAMSAKMYAMNQLQRLAKTDPKGYAHSPEIFDKYEAEIDKLVSGESPERKGFPQTWLNAFTYVRGVHANEIAEMMTNKTEFFAEDTGGGPPPPRPKDDELTPAEEAQAKKFKRTKEEILKAKKGMTFVHDNG